MNKLTYTQTNLVITVRVLQVTPLKVSLVIVTLVVMVMMVATGKNQSNYCHFAFFISHMCQICFHRPFFKISIQICFFMIEFY